MWKMNRLLMISADYGAGHYGPPSPNPLTTLTTGGQLTCRLPWQRTTHYPAVVSMGTVSVDGTKKNVNKIFRHVGNKILVMQYYYYFNVRVITVLTFFSCIYFVTSYFFHFIFFISLSHCSVNRFFTPSFLLFFISLICLLSFHFILYFFPNIYLSFFLSCYLLQSFSFLIIFIFLAGLCSHAFSFFHCFCFLSSFVFVIVAF